MNLKLKKLLRDSKGVSQIISVLVLTAVVIVGAVGAGMIMNTFSNEVADDTSAEGIGEGAATELLIAGSTTVQPLSECLAKKYMEKNKGVRVIVQGGGSGAGVASTGLDIVDIGSASRAVKSTELDKWPDIQTHQVGGSAVVVIASKFCNANKTSASEMRALYDGSGTTIDGVTVDTVYERAESSGTEETFAKWINFRGPDKQLDPSSVAEGVVGNAGVLAAVEGCTTTCCVGFVDFGYADGADVDMLNVTKHDDTGNYEPTSDNIKAALKGEDNKYPNDDKGLTRPLNYLTKGDPSTIEADFLTFARSPAQKSCFDEAGYFAVWEFA